MKKKIMKFILTACILFGIFIVGSSFSIIKSRFSNSSSIENDLNYSTLDESWGPVQLVSAGSVNDSQNPALASDGLNNTFVVWDELNQTASQDYDINLRIFKGSTDSWENIEVISKYLNEESRNPDIAIDSNNKATIVWEDPSDNDSSYYSPTIFYSSQNLDESWTKPQNITHTNSSAQSNPSLCFEGTTAHLVWNEQNRTDSVNYHINYSQNFLAGENIISNIASETDPQITLDEDGILHVIGNYYNLEYIFHISYNGIWNAPEEVGNIGSVSLSPRLALDSKENLHILWDEDPFITSIHSLKYRIWNKSAGTWGSLITSISQESIKLQPDITIDDNDNIHLVWVSNPDYPSGGDKDIYYKRYDAIDNTWTDPQLVSEGSNDASTTPLININSDGTINIIWVDKSNDYIDSGSDMDIFIRRLTLLEPSGNGNNELIPGYNIYLLIAILGISSILIFKKYQS